MSSTKSAVTIEDVNAYNKYFGITPRIAAMNKVAPETSSVAFLGSSMVSGNEGKTKGNEGLERQAPRHSAGGDSTASQQSTGSTRSANIVDTERREQLDLIKISDERKDYISLIRPRHTKRLSGWTTKGFFSSEIPNCPPGMEAIADLDVFLISKAGSTFDEVYDNEHDLGNAKYQILSPTGEVLFYGVETLDAFQSYPFNVKDIELTGTGPQGGAVFQISGSNKFANVKNGDNEQLGTITRYGLGPYMKRSDKHWNYLIRDGEGAELFRIQRTTSKEKYYDIYLPGNKESLGKITDSWPEGMGGPESGPEDTGSKLGIIINNNNFQKFDATQKALLLATAMVTYNNYMGPKENYGPNKRRFKFGLIYNMSLAGIVFMLAIVIIAVTVYSSFQPKGGPVCP